MAAGLRIKTRQSKHFAQLEDPGMWNGLFLCGSGRHTNPRKEHQTVTLTPAASCGIRGKSKACCEGAAVQKEYLHVFAENNT